MLELCDWIGGVHKHPRPRMNMVYVACDEQQLMFGAGSVRGSQLHLVMTFISERTALLDTN